jgi:hypothetical protein
MKSTEASRLTKKKLALLYAIMSIENFVSEQLSVMHVYEIRLKMKRCLAGFVSQRK